MRHAPLTVTALVLLCAVSASAATFGVSENYRQEFPIDSDGVVIIDNPFGTVDVIAVEGLQTVSWTAQKVVRGSDDDALTEGRRQTELRVAGDQHNRVIRTQVPLLHNARWSSVVNYAVRVPKSVQVRIASNSSERLHVAGVTGSVTVKNWSGAIMLEGVTGPVMADSLNGDVVVDLPSRPTANMQLSTVSGAIQLTVPVNSSFKWIATTFKGDFLSTLPVDGKFNGTKFLAVVNSSQHNPTISTTSMMGNVYVLRRGSRREQAQSVRATVASGSSPAGTLAGMAETFQRSVVEGDFVYSTPLGNISVGQVRGAARVETRAGEIQLGIVQGQCDIVSLGGPVTVGDVFGPLTARTSAGDVSINAARQGAIVATGGGMIRLLSMTGSANLRSEGGDIVVRQALGPVTAQTRSGDVTVNVDGSLRSVPLDLRTVQGNVILNVSPRFAADIDVTVLAADADVTSIRSDLKGLIVQSREQIGGKTRIHATGKVNGGGERVTLYAEDGDVHINAESQPAAFGPQQR